MIHCQHEKKTQKVEHKHSKNIRIFVKMKAFVMTAGSILLSFCVLTNAYYQKKQFYPSVVYITKSSPSMAVSCP